MNINQDKRYRHIEEEIPKLSLFNGNKVAKELLREREYLIELLVDFGVMDAVSIQRGIDNHKRELNGLEARHEFLTQKIREYEGRINQVDFGYYEYDHPGKDSVAIQEELKDVKLHIKEALRTKTAATAQGGFSFNGSEKEGKKFVEDMKKLLLRAYNAEAENAVKSVKSNKSEAALNRLNKSKEQSEKLGSMIGLKIDNNFHKARLREIELAFEHFNVLEEEKEAKREAAAEMREQKKVEREQQIAKEKFEREIQQKKAALSQMISSNFSRGNPFSKDEALVPDAKVVKLQKEIEELEESVNDVERRAANIKAGYVYVISNIGSLGENTVKIGMTRRIDPMERIKELGSASVPFSFDVHMIHYSDNAVGIENSLHKYFASRRVNLVNGRKEHFYATPQEVKAAVMKLDGTVTTFNETADAKDWKESESIRMQNSKQ